MMHLPHSSFIKIQPNGKKSQVRIKGHHRESTSTIECSTPDEPPDDCYGYEMITDDEIASIPLPPSVPYSRSRISSRTSSSSLGSTGTGPTSLGALAKPTFNSSNSSPSLSSSGSGAGTTLVLTQQELNSSVKIWYTIQMKGHYQEHLENILEATNMSEGEKPSWFLNVLTLPKRLRENGQNQTRFNLNSISKEAREQLKHLYVY